MTLYLFATTSILVHPCISFYSILSSIAQLYTIIYVSIIIIFLFIYIYVYFFLILFLLSVCRCCLCELEAYDTKTNSLYAQAYLAIKALSDSEESV